jgi:hypothetical protein
MSQADDESVVSPPLRTFTWYETWTRVLLHPSVLSFEEILHDPRASSRRAYLWVFLASLVAGIISAIAISIRGNANPHLFGNSPSFLIALCCLPLAAVLSILGLVISASLNQLVARLLGGTGTYTLMVYAIGAISAPLSIVSALLSLLSAAVPILGLLISIPLSLYGLVLEVIAIKAVNRFDWARAVLTMVILVVVGVIIIGCITAVIIAILAASGPQVQNMFRNYFQNMR